MGSAFFFIGLLMVFALNCLVWIGGWNLIAKLILKIKPDLDLRICQNYRSSYDPKQDKHVSSPVHNGVQGVIYGICILGICVTGYYTASIYVTAVFR